MVPTRVVASTAATCQFVATFSPRGAMEGETRDLTQSDRSRWRDINLVCHSAVSRRDTARRPQAPEQMAAVPHPGCLPGDPPPATLSSWGGLGGAGGPGCHPICGAGGPWGAAGVPPQGWVTLSPQGAAWCLAQLSCPRSY